MTQPGWQSQGGWQPPPNPSKRKVIGCLTAVVIFVGILIVASVIGALTSDEPAQQSAPSITDAPAIIEESETTKKPATTERQNDLREPVRDGEFEFVVQSFNCTIGKCIAKMTVENIGNDKQTWFASNQKLLSIQGESVDAGSQAGPNERALYPARKANVTLIWRVARGFKSDLLELHDSIFSGGVTVQL